jgi:hypothetical protein
MTEGQKLICNAIECAICHDVIESKHRHDFVRCKCGSVFVDGGLSYLRRGGKLEHVIERSVWSEDQGQSNEIEFGSHRAADQE